MTNATTTVGSIVMIGTFPSPETPVGGVATYVQALADEFRRQRPGRVTFWSQRVPPPATRADVVAMWRRGAQFTPDVLGALGHDTPLVHIQHEPFLFADGALGAARSLFLPKHLAPTGVRSVVTLHAVPFPHLFERSLRNLRTRAPAIAFVRLLGRLQRYVETFVVHEQPQAETLFRYGNVAPSKVTVIPHGVNALTASATTSDVFTIGTFGFLTPYKDPDFLLEEFRTFHDRERNSRLLFSVSEHPTRTSPPNKRRYEALMGAASSTSGVEVNPHIPDEELQTFVGQLDLIVLPYRMGVSSSGVGAVGLASGVPVLVPDFMAGERTPPGWTFAYRSGGLVSALERAKSTNARMKEQARSLAVERSWDETARRHWDLYDGLLGQNVDRQTGDGCG